MESVELEREIAPDLCVPHRNEVVSLRMQDVCAPQLIRFLMRRPIPHRIAVYTALIFLIISDKQLDEYTNKECFKY